MNIDQLICKLQKKVQHIVQQLQPQKELKIFAKFDRTLFSENGESVDFYLQEIQQTFQQIQSLSTGTLEQYQFLAQKLIAQCKSLSNAVIIQTKPNNQKKLLTSVPLSPRSSPHSVHKLPPRERLTEYYGYLQQLTEKYEQAKGLCHLTTDNEQKMLYALQAEQFKQRRAKCLDAIDLLEEYLAFKEGLEN